MDIPAHCKDFSDDRRIRLSVGADAIHGVDNANNLTESAIERTNARTAGCNEGTVDIEQQQLHAAILS